MAQESMRDMTEGQGNRAVVAAQDMAERAGAYAQLHGDFVPNCSALDLLLTHGNDSLAILRSGNSWTPSPPGQ